MITLALFILVIFVAAMIRSTFGFGDALFAMPLLALFMNIKTASPIVAFTGVFISLVILLENKKDLDFRGVFQLIIFSLIGVPLGAFFLKSAGEEVIKLILATILVVFSAYKLFKPHLLYLKSDKFSSVFGIFAGILGGAYNTNGPPIIVYGALKRWSPHRFRLNLQSVFLPTNVLIIISHGAVGLWSATTIRLAALSFPFILLAAFLGGKLNKRLADKKFEKYVYALLLLISLTLLFESTFTIEF